MIGVNFELNQMGQRSRSDVHQGCPGCMDEERTTDAG